MSRPTLPLHQLRVAAPCPACWDAMPGDDRVRFCPLCEKNVYNLSAMEAAAAQALIEDQEGRLCVRYYRRADGTVLAGNCPVGLRRVARRLTTWAGAIVAIGLGGFTFGLTTQGSLRSHEQLLSR